jgi:hypothetical protein
MVSTTPLEAVSKRCCGTANFPAPGSLAPNQVAQFLGQLSRSFNVDSVDQALQATDLGASVWQCFAELNLLLEQRISSLGSDALRGYHAFTRAAKHSIWDRYALAHGAAHLANTLPPQGSPLHLQLVAFLLNSVLTSYPEASIIKYTITLPPWMAGWAARWGFGSNQMNILILEAFPASDNSSSSSRGPSRTLYVPMI